MSFVSKSVTVYEIFIKKNYTVLSTFKNFHSTYKCLLSTDKMIILQGGLIIFLTYQTLYLNLSCMRISLAMNHQKFPWRHFQECLYSFIVIASSQKFRTHSKHYGNASMYKTSYYKTLIQLCFPLLYLIRRKHFKSTLVWVNHPVSDIFFIINPTDRGWNVIKHRQQ